MQENSRPLFSIITVCFNSEKTIEQTILSVLEQSFTNYEYIIVDGASIDGTLDIIKKYECLYPGKIQYVSEKDNGIYDAMNKGLALARGEIIGILNSDDFYEKNALRIVASECGEAKCKVLYGQLRVLENEIEESIIFYSHHFLSKRMICHPACFVTKDIYEKYGGFNTKYISAADYEFMLRISSEKDEVAFVPIYQILANYRGGGMSTTAMGYADKMKMLYDRKMIDKKEYLLFKCSLWVRKFLG